MNKTLIKVRTSDAAVRAITHAEVYEGMTDAVRQDIACGYLAREVYLHSGQGNDAVVVETFRTAMAEIKDFFRV